MNVYITSLEAVGLHLVSWDIKKEYWEIIDDNESFQVLEDMHQIASQSFLFSGKKVQSLSRVSCKATPSMIAFSGSITKV